MRIEDKKQRKMEVRGTVPSTSVFVMTVITLLARSLRPNDVFSWSTDTIRDPECFLFMSTSVVCMREEEVRKRQKHTHTQ